MAMRSKAKRIPRPLDPETYAESSRQKARRTRGRVALSIPTIAFGIPAHASMAILLSAFLVQGIVPGPDMLSKHLDITYTIVWSLALANVIGTLICFSFANQFARIATIRYTILLPVVMVLVYIGAFEGERSWGDIVALLLLGTFSWLMKRCAWPRPPLVLGFILGSLIERYTYLSFERYEWTWLTNWFVIVVFAISALSLAQRVVVSIRDQRKRENTFSFGRPVLSLRSGLALFSLAVFVASLFPEQGWPFGARLVPQIISIAGIALALVLVVSETFRLPTPDEADDKRQAYHRAFGYFLWIYGVLVAGLLIGFLPALVAFAFGFTLFQGRERFGTALSVSLGTFAFLWIVFDQIVHEPWPQALIGNAFPGLRSVLPWF